MLFSRYLWKALILLLLMATQVHATTIPDTKAQAILLADNRTGEILFSKNSMEANYIASITKLMTAILLVESGRLDEEFPVSNYAASTSPISLYAQPGQSLPAMELLQALLIMSANDIAVVIAEGLAGSEDEFARLMTQRAHALGAERTSFGNPHGLHAAAHASCAYDVMVIARHALTLPEIRNIVALSEVYLPSVDRTISSTNPLLSSYPGACGLKTGYTNAAGSCLVGSALRGDLELIAIVLGAPLGTAGTEAAVLLDYGFSLYAEHQVVQSGTPLGTATVERANHDIPLVAGNTITLMIRDPSLLSTELDVPTLAAPIHLGELLGELRIFYAGAHLATAAVLAQDEAAIAWYYHWEPYGMVGFAGLLLVWRRIVKRRRRLARMRASWKMKDSWR